MSLRILFGSGRRGKRTAMTLVETLVGLAAGSLLLAVIATAWVFTARSFVAIGNYTEMDNDSRNTLDLMSREIRAASALTSYTTNKVTLRNLDGSTFTYEYSPTAKTLTRQQGSNKKVLLEECDYARFSVSQRNVTNGFIFYSTTSNPSLTKLIDVSWKCSRRVIGTQINTESVQTAKIVLRN
jgi:hypothetical protein